MRLDRDMRLRREADPWPRIPVDNIAFCALTESQVVQGINRAIDEGQGGWIITANTHIVRKIHQEPQCRQLYNSASMVVADGMPILWAAKLQGTPLPERVTGSNLIWSLCRALGEHNHSVFLLGGDPGTAERAAVVLEGESPGLRLVGTLAPEVNLDANPQFPDAIRRQVALAAPKVVFVAMGFPKQEKLIQHLRKELPGTWFIGVGISFSFVSGNLRRAPRWMQQFGMEWLHRMVQEPGRLMRRYLIEDIPFALQMLIRALRRRWQPVQSSKQNR